MGNTRTNEDGFKGEYPAPLDWGRIEAEIRATTHTHEEPSPFKVQAWEKPPQSSSSSDTSDSSESSSI